VPVAFNRSVAAFSTSPVLSRHHEDVKYRQTILTGELGEVIEIIPGSVLRQSA
jgi:hypothetical protein